MFEDILSRYEAYESDLKSLGANIQLILQNMIQRKCFFKSQ